MHNPALLVEQRDTIAQLVALGFGKLLAALESPNVYTRRGRVVLAALGRQMGIPPAQAQAEYTRAQLALIELER